MSTKLNHTKNTFLVLDLIPDLCTITYFFSYPKIVMRSSFQRTFYSSQGLNSLKNNSVQALCVLGHTYPILHIMAKV